LGIAGFVLIATSTASQAKRLVFEVASIKPSKAGDHHSRTQITTGQINVTKATLKDLIHTPYHVENLQIVEDPVRLSSDRWNIQASAPEKVSQSQMNEMMQSLLADRFQLKFHKESRRLPVYELVIARNGPKVRKADPSPTNGAHSTEG